MQKLTFDIETTGPDATKDRIVQLGITVTDEQGNIIIDKSKLYNPEITILPAATQVHGITQDDVKDCPTFREDAKKLKKIFENKIIITYNGLVFDIPILLNEFERAGVELNLSDNIIDVYRIEKKLHPTTLSNTYKHYTGKELEGAHDAMADIHATNTVLEYQIEEILNQYSDDEKIGDVMNKLYELSGTNNLVDFYGKFTKDENGYLIVNFGKKCKGQRLVDNPGFAEWMLKESFPSQIKKLIKQELKKEVRKQFSKPSSGSLREELTGKTQPSENGGYIPMSDDLPF